MTNELKKRGILTVRQGFPELLQYWDTEKNDRLGINPDNVKSSGRVVVHLKCPHCGREYERKLNNAYSVQKANGSYTDGYCAACRPRNVQAIERSKFPKKKDYELLGFYPNILPFFITDDRHNRYARMPEDPRFIRVHLDQKYIWNFRGTVLTATIREMLKGVKV